MRELIRFNIDDASEYCPVAVNCTFLRDFGDDGVSPVCCDESILERILTGTEAMPEKIHVIDFSGVDQISPSECHYTIMTGHNYILHIKKKYSRAIKEKMEENGKDCFFFTENDNGEWSVMYFSRDESIHRFLSNTRWDKQRLAASIHREVILDFFMSEVLQHGHKYSIPKLKYLESSNVFVNCYINVKSLFSFPDYLHMIVYDMAEVLKERFHEIYDQNQVCLLGVSNNGIILSKLVAYKLRLEAKSLNHIGPRYNIEKRENTDRLSDSMRNSKFILISDVMCMGGEYRIAKGIIDVIGAELLGAVGVVKIVDVYRGGNGEASGSQDERKRIFALVNDINSYEKNGNQFDYHIYAEGR